jgi:hypothetical protein
MDSVGSDTFVGWEIALTVSTADNDVVPLRPARGRWKPVSRMHELRLDWSFAK